MVMTPERLLYTLISYPEMSIDYLFIDEAHKLSEPDGKTIFTFCLTISLIKAFVGTKIAKLPLALISIIFKCHIKKINIFFILKKKYMII